MADQLRSTGPEPEDASRDRASPDTLALGTKLEEDFVSPLTALRGALEILRDFPDLPAYERKRFLDSALEGCAQLERGVKDLAVSVYGAAEPNAASVEEESAFADRIQALPEAEVIDIDFSGFTFRSAELVNEFYDAVDRVVTRSRKKWWFIVNHSDFHVWPEAWVAFAHRSKKVQISFALGVARYAEGEGAPSEPGLLLSREAALAAIDAMKAETPARV